jgi:hypothetical protein
MPLTFRPTEGFGRDQFGVFDGDRKIGRIYKTERSDWFWGLDWLAAGEKLLTDHPGPHEEAMARFEATWERVDRKGETR